MTKPLKRGWKRHQNHPTETGAAWLRSRSPSTARPLSSQFISLHGVTFMSPVEPALNPVGPPIPLRGWTLIRSRKWMDGWTACEIRKIWVYCFFLKCRKSITRRVWVSLLLLRKKATAPNLATKVVKKHFTGHASKNHHLTSTQFTEVKMWVKQNWLKIFFLYMSASSHSQQTLFLISIIQVTSVKSWGLPFSCKLQQV